VKSVISETIIELDKQLAKLSRREIAAKSLENSKAILVKNLHEAVEILNEYAAEHLIIATENAEAVAEKSSMQVRFSSAIIRAKAQAITLPARITLCRQTVSPKPLAECRSIVSSKKSRSKN
jgi:hypothetical protein